MPKSGAREVIFEFMKIGTSIRVTAVDADTGTEVIFQAPTGTSKREMQRIGISKLKYVLKRQKS